MQEFSIIFSCGPQRAKDSSKIDVWGPNDYHRPTYFYVFWSWQGAKQVWFAGRIWPMGCHLRRSDLLIVYMCVCMHPECQEESFANLQDVIKGFSIIFPCRPQRAEDSSKIDVWGPNDHHCPMYFYLYWSWQGAKQVWSAGQIWPMGCHLRRLVLML